MSELLTFARETARQAGRLLCEYYDRRQTIGTKSTDIDVVTEADLASERLLVDAIRARFPEHRILSEEGLGDPVALGLTGTGAPAGETAYLWLVDPLDGTVNYAHGFPFWGVTLALADRGQVVLGVVYDPLRDEMFWTERGAGAWCNGRRLRVSGTARLRDALVSTGFAYQRATLADNNLAEFAAVMPRVRGVRRAGAAVLDLAYLASGRLDAYWEMHLNAWDWAAGQLLVEEAGGTVTTLDGEPWSLQMNHLVASNGRLHEQLLALLKSRPK